MSPEDMVELAKVLRTAADQLERADTVTNGRRPAFAEASRDCSKWADRIDTTLGETTQDMPAIVLGYSSPVGYPR